MTATAAGACAASSNCNSPATAPGPGLSSLQLAICAGVQLLQLWPVACRCASSLANGVLMASTGAGQLVIEPTIANYMYICMVHNYSFIIYSAQRVINYILHNSYACATPPMYTQRLVYSHTCTPRMTCHTAAISARPTKRGDRQNAATTPRLRWKRRHDCVRMCSATVYECAPRLQALRLLPIESSRH